MEVKSLDNELKAAIRSGYCINNVTQCINELVLNSLDAKSSHIAVRANLVSFRIQVVDDGEGITEANLEHVGKRNHTNKCHTTKDLEAVRKQFGFKGEALAAIAINAKTMKITSRAWNTISSQTYGKTFQKTIEGLQHTIEETADRPSGGTTVTVQGFMYNLPVRQKRTKSLEFNDIKANLQRLFILHPNVTFSLRDDSTRKVIFSSTAVNTIETALRQQVEDLEENLIKYYSISKGRTSLKTLIYLKEYSNNKWQMFYVNKLPVKSASLANFVNEILSRSALTDNGASCDAKTRKKGNNYYLYLFNIVCPRSKYHIVNYDEVEFKNPDSLLKLIEKYLGKILEKEKLIAPKAEERKKKNVEAMQRRIRLSGFPGAFKASAVRRPGEAVDRDDNIDNIVNNSADPKSNMTRKSKSDSHDRDYQEKPCVLSSCSSSNLESRDGQKNNNQLEEQHKEIGDTRQVQVNVAMNVDEPLETTSTIGRNYVLNKFIENNPYNMSVEAANRRIRAEREEQYKRKYFEEFEVRKAREQAEIERARHLERLNRERLCFKGNAMINHEMYVHTDSRGRGIPNNYYVHVPIPRHTRVEENVDLYDNHRNEVALANYYDYKHRIKPVLQHTAKYDEYQRREHRKTPEFLWKDAQDIEKKDLLPNKYQYPLEAVPSSSFAPKWRIPSETYIPMNKRSYNINTIPDHRYVNDYATAGLELGFNQKPKESLFQFSPEKPNYHQDFDFEQLDKENFDSPFDCMRTPRQVDKFEQTVWDLDVPGCPQPEKRRKYDHLDGAFFRLRASEKITRLKRLNHAGINRMNISSCHTRTKTRTRTKTKTTTIINDISGHFEGTAVSPTSNPKINRIKRPSRPSTRSKTLISCKTVITTISSKIKHTEVKKRLKKKHKRKVKIRANKGTNTSAKDENFQQCVHELDETVIMMEQSIQCTIANQDLGKGKDTPIESRAQGVQTDDNHEQAEEENVARNPVKIDVISHIVIQPVQDPDITSNEVYCKNIDHVADEVQEDIIEGTPNENFTLFTGTATLKNKAEIDKNVFFTCNSSNLQVDELLDYVNKDCDDINEPEPGARDDSVLFNLSTAIKELASEWSFNEKWPTKDTLKCATNVNQSKTKQIIETADIFGVEFSSVLNLPNLDAVQAQTEENVVSVSNEWSRKVDEQGGSYYINKRTGNTMSQQPVLSEVSELFNMAVRPLDLPKGFSQKLRSPPRITDAITSDTKRAFHAAVCESYDDDLACVKWKKHYLKSADYEEFFKGIYDERFIADALRELQLPKMRQSAPNQLNSVAFTAGMFRQLDVLRQYDRKFIVAVWKPEAREALEAMPPMLVVFDQHAVHERIRLEELLRKYILIQKDTFEVNLQLTLKTIAPFEMSCNRNTYETCQKHPDTLKSYGLTVTCPKEDSLVIHSVPECLFNKVLRESSKRSIRLMELTKLLMCEIVDSIYDAISSNQWVPRMLIDLINSEACRGAVMFGDALSIEECGELIKDLSACDLPFQCAHGRPTCVPLSVLNDYAQEEKKISLSSLRRRRKVRRI